MNSKKAMVWYYLILIGFILGTTSFYYYFSLYNPASEKGLSQEIINQFIKTDLDINKIRFYIKKSAEVSIIHSIYDLAEKGGFSKEPTCGSYADLPLYQSDKDDFNTCMPKFEEELSAEFSDYLNSYLDEYHEADLSRADNYDWFFKIDKNLNLLGSSKEKIIIPNKAAILADYYSNLPFDYYNITLYGTVSCAEGWEEKKPIDETSYPTSKLSQRSYNIKIFEPYSTQGFKYLHTDVKYPNTEQGKPKDGSDLYYKSMYKLTNPNERIAFTNIAPNPKENSYCIPSQISKIHNLELRTYKDGKTICQVRTQEDGLGSSDFGGMDIKTWSTTGDNNEDGYIDTGCKDSPTFLECPGIRIYYCGKTGWDSYPKRRADFPGWDPIYAQEPYITKAFVWVYQGDEPIEERPFKTYLHAKTAAKFLIDFDPSYTKPQLSIMRDKFKNLVKDKETSTMDMLANYGRMFGQEPTPSATEGESPTYVYKFFRPSFSIDVNYNNSDYKYIRYGIQNVTSECSSETTNLKSCVIKAIGNLNSENYKWALIPVSDEKDRYFAFQLTTNKRFFPKSEPIIYNFASYIKDHPPSPITPNAISKPGDDNSAIVYFEMPEDKDIERYNVYYSSDFDLKDKPIQYGTIKDGEFEAEKATIDANNIFGLKNSPLSCEYNFLGSTCPPHMEKNNIYVDDDKIGYILIDNLKNAKYSIAVTATDIKGNEIEKVVYTTDVEIKDNLAPGKIFQLDYNPENSELVVNSPDNIDGSALNDDISFYYFIKKDSCSDIIKTNDGQLDLTYRRTEDDIIQILQNAQSKEQYCVAAFAVDKNNNPVRVYQNQDKLTVIIIKPEYRQIFANLYTTKLITVP